MPRLVYKISSVDDSLSFVAGGRERVILDRVVKQLDKARSLLEGDSRPIPDQVWKKVERALRSPTPATRSPDTAYDKVITLEYGRKWRAKVDLVPYELEFNMFSSVADIQTELMKIADELDEPLSLEGLASEIDTIAAELDGTDKVALSPLQEMYRDYFLRKMEEHGIDSPSSLPDEAAMKKFFNAVRDGWQKGVGPR